MRLGVRLDTSNEKIGLLLPVCSGSCTGPGYSEVAGNLLPRPVCLCHMKEWEVGQLGPVEQDGCRIAAFLGADCCGPHSLISTLSSGEGA